MDAEKILGPVIEDVADHNRVNSDRGNKPSISAGLGVPQNGIERYNESTRAHFEPREAHKGNVARSMVCFCTAYGDDGLDVSWFETRIPTSIEGYDADPATEQERERSTKPVHRFVVTARCTKWFAFRAVANHSVGHQRSSASLNPARPRIRSSP